MAEKEIIDIVRRYLNVLKEQGIDAAQAVLFGSFANGTANEWSDIDLVVIAPQFDGTPDRKLVFDMWEARGRVDHRIEPIPCGKQEWGNGDSGRPIIEIAREEGVLIA
ncbi:MAG: nucleotidyltransferase domain-containing protein [Candidatus Sumerlaeia bacterium]